MAMTETMSAAPPPFSAVLLAGIALAPVPVALVQPVCDRMLAAVLRRHPDVLDRLSDYHGATVCIDPLDMPVVLMLHLDARRPRLTVKRRADEAQAVVRAPLALLMAMAEGSIDGDAAFFSRQMVIEGDTGLVLALRNALDGAGIDLRADLLPAFGLLRRPAERALGLWDRLSRDVGRVAESLTAPLRHGIDVQGLRLAELEQDVAALKSRRRA